MIQPSCPVLVVHNDDAFRKKLITALDQTNFSVTATAEGDASIALLESRTFNVVLIGLNLATGDGRSTVDYLKDKRAKIKCGILIVGDSDPGVRTYATWVSETLLKPVDPEYVATRARTYCRCS